ncbi:MAG: glycosyltransferase [Hyphomicrobiales bacterium]|nr:glycosyltransferase [Hyphomicrobiales bacterium]MCP5373053.1 glycosyltransferase [Hyphomicrobiales bacterium]
MGDRDVQDVQPATSPAPRACGRIAVLIPCYNEAAAIRPVVEGFRKALPEAGIFVYDNNSTDGTADIARAAGATVRRETFQGKGNVVRRMFADIEADTYVMVDGDNTYDAPSVIALLEAYVEHGVDMVNGARVTEYEAAYRPGHRFGNWMLTTLVAQIFGQQFKDMLSGYRVFSRRFVKSFPALSRGFEIETELTVHALELRMATIEVETPYYARPEGSVSKLSTLQDGRRILMAIGKLVKEERPLQFFSAVFAVLAVTSMILIIPIIQTYMETGLVPRFPTAILATGIMLLAFLSLSSGFVLDTVTRGRQEMKRMRYLSEPGPGTLASEN